uniref:Uncharacterized protein n=1 Tax=Rhizophora mucronata TaxID=61149 RepID=A0A2P2P9Y8_RHIMU
MHWTPEGSVAVTASQNPVYLLWPFWLLKPDFNAKGSMAGANNARFHFVNHRNLNLFLVVTFDKRVSKEAIIRCQVLPSHAASCLQSSHNC